MSDSSGTVKVEGASRLRRTLRDAGANMKDLTAVHRQVGAVIVPEAKRLAPLGPAANGHIRNTIRATANRSSTTIKAGNARQRHAAVNHWGWHRRNIRPNPWVSRAAQATEPRWVAVYFAGMERIIRQIEGK